MCEHTLNMSEKVLCVICEKSAVKKRLYCKNCNMFVHPSCAVKSKRNCCDKVTLIQEKLDDKDLFVDTEFSAGRSNDNRSILDVESDLEDSDESLIEKSFCFENKMLKEMNQELREKVDVLEKKIVNSQEIGLTQVNNEQNNACLNTVAEVLRQLQVTVNDNFRILLSEIKDIRFKMNKLGLCMQSAPNTMECHNTKKAESTKRNIVEQQQPIMKKIINLNGATSTTGPALTHEMKKSLLKNVDNDQSSLAKPSSNTKTTRRIEKKKKRN